MITRPGHAYRKPKASKLQSVKMTAKVGMSLQYSALQYHPSALADLYRMQQTGNNRIEILTTEIAVRESIHFRRGTQALTSL